MHIYSLNAYSTAHPLDSKYYIHNYHSITDSIIMSFKDSCGGVEAALVDN